MMLTVTRSITSKGANPLKKFRLAITGNRKYTHYMANWNKHVPINALLEKSNAMLEADEDLHYSPEFLSTVALHMLALCKSQGWRPEIDGWDPPAEEWAASDIETAEDFDNFLHQIYNEADLDLVWLGIGSEEIPKVLSNIEGVGWIGDFRKFERTSNGS